MAGTTSVQIKTLNRHRADLAPLKDVASSEKGISRPFATQRLRGAATLDNVINAGVYDQGGVTLND
jgi:hypothetical protein